MGYMIPVVIVSGGIETSPRAGRSGCPPCAANVRSCRVEALGQGPMDFRTTKRARSLSWWRMPHGEASIGSDRGPDRVFLLRGADHRASWPGAAGLCQQILISNLSFAPVPASCTVVMAGKLGRKLLLNCHMAKFVHRSDLPQYIPAARVHQKCH
jgi:hypothetical protein